VLGAQPAGAEPVRGWLNIGLTVMLLACVAVIVGSAVLRWMTSVKSDSNSRHLI
jgi:hypothetical protein